MTHKLYDNRRPKPILKSLNKTLTHLDNSTSNSQIKDFAKNKQFYKTLECTYKPQSSRNGKRRNKSQTRYSEIIQKNSQQKFVSEDLSGIRHNSISFRPTFEPRRTFGNLKYLLEVVHKKIRAKNIQSVFEQSIYVMNENRGNRKGLKGAKLSRHSNFVNAYQNKSMNWKMSQNSENKILFNEVEQYQLQNSSFRRYHQNEKQTQQVNENNELLKQIPHRNNGAFKTQVNYHEYKKGYRRVGQKSIKRMQQDIQEFGVNIKNINYNT